MFQVQEIKKPDNSPSPLTLLLQQEEVMKTNPYYSYSRHNGEVSYVVFYLCCVLFMLCFILCIVCPPPSNKNLSQL